MCFLKLLYFICRYYKLLSCLGQRNLPCESLWRKLLRTELEIAQQTDWVRFWNDLISVWCQIHCRWFMAPCFFPVQSRKSSSLINTVSQFYNNQQPWNQTSVLLFFSLLDNDKNYLAAQIQCSVEKCFIILVFIILHVASFKAVQYPHTILPIFSFNWSYWLLSYEWR